MAYPPKCFAHKNFALAEAKGETIDQIALAGELARVCESVNQVIDFIRATQTADKLWQPAAALEMTLNESEAYTAIAAQTDFLFTGYTADTATDTARVFVNGLKLPQSSVTLQSDRVVIPASTAGDVVEVELYDDADGVLTKLASTAAALGASLIGVEDAATNFVGSEVETVLAEIATDAAAVEAALTAILGAVLKDGTVAFEADQSMGGHKLTDVATGTSPGDAVNVAQLNALQALFGDLSNTFLALSGGQMAGPINLGGNVLTNLPTPVGGSEAATKDYVDDAVAATAADALLLDGSNAMAADLDVDSNKLVNVADGVAGTDGVNKDQMDQAIADAVDITEAGFNLAGQSLDGAVAVSSGGVYHFAGITISGSFTLGAFLRVFSDGNLICNATMTGAAETGSNIELYAEGDITITAPIAAPQGNIVIEATGNVTIQAGATLDAGAPNTHGNNVRIKAGGDVTIADTIDAEAVEIDCAGDFAHTSTITAVHAVSRGAGGTLDAGLADMRVLQRYLVDWAAWAGTAGDARISTRGASGGAGGTGGGNGGKNQAFDVNAGVESPVKGAARPYLFPPTLGAGGGGGSTSDGGHGGGLIDIYVGGDATLTGSSLVAIGGTTAQGVSAYGAGGGGGGTIRVSCKGTVTDGTQGVDGGDGRKHYRQTTAGVAVAVGPTSSQAPTPVRRHRPQQAAKAVRVAAAGGAGAAGTTATVTLTAAQIQGLYDDGWLQPGKFVVAGEPA